MHIIVNGESREVAENMSAAALLEELALAGQRLAMEVNEEILPRSQHADYCFKPGDRIEIVRAIGGG